MRHSLFVITYCAFSSSGTFATDRVVSPSGLYNNISSAIAASSNGDRILVETGNYAENLDITKSISILPLVEGTRYTVNGSAYVAMAAGGRAVLSGARVMVGLWLSMAHTAHTEVVVVDSYLSSCSTVDPFVRTELYRDTIFANASISHGSIIGSYIRGDDNYGAFVLVQGPSSQPEEVLVIGNSIGVPTGGAGINLQTDAIFHVENNFVRTSPNVAPAVRINRVGALGGAPSTILNNTFYKHVNVATSTVSNDAFSYFALVVKNNANIGYTSGAVGSISGWSQLVNTHNPLVAASAINLTTGGPSNGSPLINTGDPDPRYLDLDLTTNDVGCYGGSNSRANFTTGMGSAVVGFMNAPRVVSQGEPVNISATGFDR